jgi:glyoxylase-like metal-dependent hydrolase (beta-lactamase superfamily II)
MEFAPNLHLVPGVIANAYLIMEDGSATLIDAGLPGSHRRILRYLSERGYSPARLTRIFLTHSDVDHVGGLAALKRLTGARLYASPIEAGAIVQGKRSRLVQPRHFGRRMAMSLIRAMFHAAPAPVDELLHDGQTLDGFGGIQVLYTPGHTPGHISLFAPKRRVLFSGDSMISRGGRVVGSLPSNTWDAALAAESFRRQAALAPRLICSGHGPVAQLAEGEVPTL